MVRAFEFVTTEIFGELMINVLKENGVLFHSQ